MSNFEDLKKSLEEAIAYKQGKLKNVKTHKWEVIPLPEFDATTIKAIRLNAQMTQAIFATCIGVTPKAFEPGQAVVRDLTEPQEELLALCRNHHHTPQKMAFCFVMTMLDCTI